MTQHRSPKAAAAAIACSGLLLFGACSNSSSNTTTSGSSSTGAASVSTSTSGDTSALRSMEDDTHADLNDGDYDASTATVVTLSDGASTVDGSGASVEGDVVTITQAGTYILSGTLTDGQVVVDSTGDGKVNLVLDGVDITSASTSPVVVTAADEAVVILAEGSTNKLADSSASAADDETEDAPTATLFSMADLTIAGTGSLEVTGASNDAIGSKDGLVVLSGAITVNALDDGIRGKDYLMVDTGTIEITAGGDGLKSDNDTAGEEGWIQVNSGSITVDATSQGLDAVGSVLIADGTVDITNSEEGLQAMVIDISGGTVNITATDDGFSATAHTVEGGSESIEDGVTVNISGGTVTVTAAVDGVDSNGHLTITGGTLAIASQAGGGGGNAPFDVNGDITTPGIVTVANSGIEAGQRVMVTDSAGTVVASFVANSNANSWVVTATGIETGSTYTVYAGGDASVTSVDELSEVASVTATDVSAAATQMGGGGGGGAPGGGFPGGPTN